MAKYPNFEGELLTSIRSHSQSTNLKIDVMGCQTALYEWADSYDSKVCVLTLRCSCYLSNTNTEAGLGASQQMHCTHPEGQY